ncbi:dihydrofolate reductase family protein [Ekhidna sp.]|uniref:dihydrofolate reductase family protein n=1 Tax=Ekhidna sp. TaxID=2608089 RepID=UPI003B514F55
MRRIVYYVATSLDGFIAGKNGDCSMFKADGEGVEQYFYDLESFDTVIMGRKTYEFGYQFGLKPGQPAYQHMDHYIFSESLKFEKCADQVKVVPLDLSKIVELKNEIGSDIYLCGGGIFSGWLMKNGLIDIVKLKINPIILGSGVRLFEGYNGTNALKTIYHQSFDDLQIVTYAVSNS